MGDFPFAYERIQPTTWAYMSSLLMLAIFFKFNRFWSVRNFDLILIILLAPGLLMVEGGSRWAATYPSVQASSRMLPPGLSEGGPSESFRSGDVDQKQVPEEVPRGTSSEAPEGAVGREALTDSNGLSKDLSLPGYQLQRWGYYWLFAIQGLFLIRMLLDPRLERKPVLDPNLSAGGLVFLGLSLMVFLFVNVMTSTPTNDDLEGVRDSIKMIQREATNADENRQLVRRGPGYRLFSLLPVIPSFDSGREMLEIDADEGVNLYRFVIAAKVLAVISQVLVVLGLVFFCYRHYGNFNVGVGTGVIYLMLPYTAMFTGHVMHALPAALLVWALVAFRRPAVAGVLLGLAIGVSYYPIFLLPLWISFYWKRGLGRFLLGVLASISVCILGLVFTSVDMNDFFRQLQTMFGFWWPLMGGLEGIWALGWNQWYRMPILIAFIALCVSFAAWPAEKNIGTLVSYSAAVMIGVQFWHGFGGGLYMAWYLPLVLLTFFRPNLKGRVASTELEKVHWRRRLPLAEGQG